MTGLIPDAEHLNLLATSKEDLQRLFRMLGLAITLPAVLVSGPLAGYLFGQWSLRKWTLNQDPTMVFMLIGLAGSAVQAVRLLKRIFEESRKKTL